MKYIISAITFLTLNLYAQDVNKSLLWEISGNGLLKPSYLYGTIHSNQEKFFDMGDSVFVALESTEAFAGELDMDSLPFFAGKIASGLSGKTDITSLLSVEEFEKLKAKIKEKIGISYDELPVKDPILIAVLLEKDYFQGNMPFFIDEYLYKIAKEKNKKILGLESFDDQLNLFNELTDDDKRDMLLGIINEDTLKTKKTYEELTDAYYNNDLIKLNEIVTSELEGNSNIESKFLTQRNHNMAARIAQLAKTQSLFIAVGSAHLPGKEGVIELLKKKGFSLRPVKVIRTGVAKTYLDEIAGKPWEPYSPGDNSFSIEMPGKASTLPMQQQNEQADAVFYFDESTNVVYMVATYRNEGDMSASSRDSISNLFISTITASGGKIEGNINDITYSGMEGKEFKASINGGTGLAKMFFNENRFYWLQVISAGKIEDNSNISRFFNSFKVNKLN